MTEFAFDPNQCGFGEVPKIPDDPWFDDPGDGEFVDPILACPPEAAPIPPPEFPCPTITIVSSNQNPGIRAVKQECCNWELHVDELGCPQFPQGNRKTGIQFVEPTTRQLQLSDISITFRYLQDVCGFEAKPTIRIPYTQLKPGHLWDDPLNPNGQDPNTEVAKKKCVMPDKLQIQMQIIPRNTHSMTYRLHADLPCGYTRLARVTSLPQCYDEQCTFQVRAENSGHFITAPAAPATATLINTSEDGCLSDADEVTFFTRQPTQIDQILLLTWNGAAWLNVPQIDSFIIIPDGDVPAASWNEETNEYILGKQNAFIWRRRNPGEGGFSQDPLSNPAGLHLTPLRDDCFNCVTKRVYNFRPVKYKGCIPQHAISDSSGDLYILPGTEATTTTSSTTSTTTPDPNVSTSTTEYPKPCNGECRFIWQAGDGNWLLDDDGCSPTTTSTTSTSTTSTTSTSSTTTLYPPCICDATSTSTSTTTDEPPQSTTTTGCKCVYPDFCGEEDGECTYTDCTIDTVETPGSAECSTSTSTTTGEGEETSTTTCDCNATTTLGPSCRDGCSWVCKRDAFGQIVWRLSGSGCLSCCPCRTPERICDFCGDFEETPCEIPPAPPGEPGDHCDGKCWYVSSGGGWSQIGDFCRSFTNNDCHCQPPSRAPELPDGCEVTWTYCACGDCEEPPPREPDECQAELDDPGQCANCTSTSSTSSTTSTGPGGCLGDCKWKVEGDPEDWAIDVNDCGEAEGTGNECDCSPPPYAPHSSCETAKTPCIASTTTSTTTPDCLTFAGGCAGTNVEGVDFGCSFKFVIVNFQNTWELDNKFCPCPECECPCPPSFSGKTPGAIYWVGGGCEGDPCPPTTTSSSTTTTTEAVEYWCYNESGCGEFTGEAAEGGPFSTIEECEGFCEEFTTTTSSTTTSSTTTSTTTTPEPGTPVWVPVGPCTCNEVPFDDQDPWYADQASCEDTEQGEDPVWFCVEFGCVEAPCGAGDGWFDSELECEEFCATTTTSGGGTTEM